MDRPNRIISDIYTALPRLRAVRSSGAMVTLSDGKQYIDLMNGKGSVTLGHHHPAVNSAITRHLQNKQASASCWSNLHEVLSNRIIGDVGMSDVRLALFSTGRKPVEQLFKLRVYLQVGMSLQVRVITVGMTIGPAAITYWNPTRVELLISTLYRNFWSRFWSSIADK